MNEGDSAGGGHQGSTPAPPAVPIRRPNHTITTTNKQTATVTGLQVLHMPQTSTNIPTSTATTTVTAISVPTSTIAPQEQLSQQQQPSSSSTANITGPPAHITASDSPPPIKRAKYDALSSTAVCSIVSGVPINVVGSLLPTTGTKPAASNIVKATTGTTAIPTQSTTPQDFNSLKKRVLEHKYLRLRSLKEKHNENVAELFYLQSGGNMMDYPAWRKKSPTPQLVSFSNAYRLNQLVIDEKANEAAATSTGVAALGAHQQQPTAENIATIIGVSSGSVHQQQLVQQKIESAVASVSNSSNNKSTPSYLRTVSDTTSSNVGSSSGLPTQKSNLTTETSSCPISSVEQDDSVLPQGAEIKIPAVGATPVAVSTKLPAAVVQLSQQGHIPGRPLGGRHGMVFGQISTLHAVGNSSVPLVPGGTPLIPVGSTSAQHRNGHSSSLATSVGNNAIVTTTPPPPSLYGTTHTSGLLRTASANGGVGAITSSSNNAQEFSFKAKQEVYVMQRISELQREGLWTEKRLPKLQEPSRSKAHWDYLLEEMVWLATDFAQERKWKKNAAKKCARMVQKYFQDKANAAQKAEKAQEAHQRRVAAFIAKEIKYFWSNVEKLVEYKHHTKLEEKRKKALDQHLSFIVDQTEKFSQQLVEGMNKTVGADATVVSTTTSVNASRISSPKQDDNGMSDDDFRPDTGSEDDEETIAKADEEETNVKEEIDVLEKESRMELEDLLNDSLIDYLENRDKLMEEEKKGINAGGDVDDIDDDDEEYGEEDEKTGSSKAKKKVKEDDDGDAEFEANEASDDDENTISKQEQEEMDVDHQKELDELEADNDLTVEQLLQKYKSRKIEQGKKNSSTASKQLDSDDDDDDDDDETQENFDDMSEVSTVVDDGESSSGENSEDNEESEEEFSETDQYAKEKEGGLKSLLDDNNFAGNNKDDMIKDAAALAESIQPKGNTLSSTDVVTPVPFLLKHSLREYQHIGLDWLVTMNERKLNGILADEMGLGKTIQTIALLAHLACGKGNWGPHLIVVPSSVMLNWEMEFKKWCPGFKILTYYGTQKERKLKRVGWTKPNAFHVCITSYKLVVQDQQSFRRKKWKYLILDEAQNIKNFKSQRWQLLLNFSTERRLLLTGTPLQNDLMELWSLMHFLMPYVFSSHREFKEWFSNPMTGMIEGNMEYNETLISRLHKVIRPFLLRRLKKEVEKQMPKKYEHVIMCRLSNRQRYLYDDFMSRAKTKETLQTGNLLSVINVLMQLRKVCNHPNMFEVRPTISPFQMEGITFQSPRLVCDLLEYDPLTQIDLKSLNLLLIQLELTLSAYASYRSHRLGAPRQLIEEIDSVSDPPPRCPTGKFKFHIRVRDADLQQNISRFSAKSVRVGASPAMKTEGNVLLPLHSNPETGTNNQSRLSRRMVFINPVNMYVRPRIIECGPGSSLSITSSTNSIAAPAHSAAIRSSPSAVTTTTTIPTTKVTKLVHGSSGKPYLVFTSASSNNSNSSSASNITTNVPVRKPAITVSNSKVISATRIGANKQSQEKPKLLVTIAKEIKSTTAAKSIKIEVDEELEVKDSGGSHYEDEANADDTSSELDPIYNMAEILKQRKEARTSRLKLMAEINRRRFDAVPIYGADCREALSKCSRAPNRSLEFSSWQTRGYTNCRTAMDLRDGWTLSKIIKSYEQRYLELKQMFANFLIYVPSTCAPRIDFYAQHLTSTRLQNQRNLELKITQKVSPKLALLHPIISAMTTQFPDPRLIQYDCGKLQTLDRLLRQLKSEQHRVLIFTQMTKMLDVLEAFLNYHGHIYLRLDGSTRVEQRQVLMERFNGDKRIFCFILSTRSGGVGINLTGADTVIFYDSDWNPTMDAQAQDRCHRIGQTRDVHIYRLVSEKTIEVNILKKANQKRMLSDMAIEGGNFTTTYFKSSTIKDLFNVDQNEQEQAIETISASGVAGATEKPSTSQNVPPTTILSGDVVGNIGCEIDTEKQSLRVFETALAAAEDEQDVQATKTAKAEVAADLAEFDETIPIDETTTENIVPQIEMSKADLEMQNIVKQLSPIERYAMRFVEETGAAWTAEQMRAAEAEIEAQKREWEANRLAAMQKEEELLKQDVDPDDLLTYSRRDAINQIWISPNTMEVMPMWCPPTPPQEDNDLYIDYSLSFMYDMTPIPESELPPVFVRKDYKRSRSDAGFLLDGSRRPTKIRKEDSYYAPRSLFDRPSPALARIRRDLKNQRYRGIFKPNVQIPGLKPLNPPQKPPVEPDVVSEWSIYEDISIVHVLVNLQGLPCNLMQLSPGHSPNWDLVAEIVNLNSKTYRSPKQCRWRYESVIQPREEGKLVESPKKQKKLKAAMMKSEYLRTPLRYLRTTQLYVADNNTTFTKVMRSRFDCIKAAYLKKAPPPKRHFSTPSLINPKHMEVLQDYGVLHYDHPLSPQSIAMIKANKMREKQQRSQQCPPPAPPPSAQQQQQVTTSAVVVQTPTHTQLIAAQQQQQQQQQQHTQLQELVQQPQQNVATAVTLPAGTTTLQAQQLQIQHISAAQQGSGGTTAIVLQHTTALPQQQQQQQTTQYGTVSASGQPQLMRTTTIGGHPQSTTTQIVKAIVTPQSGVLTAGQMQQLTQQAQHVQLQQSSAGGSLVGTPTSVSVVLTAPVQTLSPAMSVSVQQAQAQQQQQLHSQGGVTVSVASAPQMVSISPQTIVSSGSAQVGSIVQTLPASPSQSMPQVVSVSQLATVGTVLTTSANQQQNATVTTINASALRAQRIVTATPGTLQDVVLQQQRGGGGNASPTIVSMSSLAGVTPSQFQATQLRLASMSTANAQQVTTKGGVSVSALQQSGKIAASNVGNAGNAGQPTHIQLYRQRQQLKVLQTSPAGTGQNTQTVVQNASGQTALVNAAGTIIQGSIMQTAPGPSGSVQVQGQKVAVATVSSGNVVTQPVSAGGGVVTSVATVQVAHNQGRTQFIKQVASAAGKQSLSRQVGTEDMLLVKRQVISASGHTKPQVIQQGQIFTTGNAGSGASLQLQQQTLGATNQQQQQQVQVTPQQIATLVKASAGGGNTGSITVATSGGQAGAGASTTAGTVNMALSQLKPGGQIKVTMANQSQMRQLQMQQHLGIPRKIRMTQIAAAAQAGGGTVVATGTTGSPQTVQGASSSGGNQAVSGGSTLTTQKSSPAGGMQTQLVHIQNPKSLSSSVTVQQIQQVMRQGQQGTLATTGLVLGKTSVGRVIPVSVSPSQPNQRQTIQVMSAASAQALAAGNLRAHVTSGQNTIKVASSAANQSHQALINAIQQHASAQQSQRQNASPVRLQTTANGSLVAVVQQQALQQQHQTQPQQLQQQQQQQQQQNVVTATLGISTGNTITSSGGVSTSTSNISTTPADVITIAQSTITTSSVGVPQQQHQQQTQQQQGHQQQQSQQQQTTQVTTPQQVRTLVKKKIMQIRSEKD